MVRVFIAVIFLQLKIWSSKIETEISDKNGADEDEEDDTQKKMRLESLGCPKPLTRTPLMTLVGHKEGVSGVTWLDQPNEVCTSSLDHTIKVWDTENGGMKSELVGNKAFFGLSYSRQHRLLLTSGCERTIRTYDPRSTDGLLVKSAYASHQVMEFDLISASEFLNINKNNLDVWLYSRAF
jgi:ribosome biogenesis protein YTM1